MSTLAPATENAKALKVWPYGTARRGCEAQAYRFDTLL